MALTRSTPRVYSNVTRTIGLPLTDAASVFEGAAVGINASTGRVRSLVAGDLFAGFATQSVTSVGLPAGSQPAQVRLQCDGEVLLAVSGVVASSIGSSVFASDDGTFSLTGTSLVGDIVSVPSAGQAVVAFEGARQRLSSAQALAARSIGSGAGLGGTTITRTELLALADAGGLTPGAVYLTTDGLLCDALTARFLQPRGPWFSYGPRVVVGSATAEATLLGGIYTPPVGPSGVVRIRFSVEMDDGTTGRRLYLRQVGYSSSFPLFDRTLQTAGQWDGDIEVKIVNQGSSSVQLLRSAGNSAQGMGTSIARAFAMDLTTSKEFAFSGFTAKTGTLVNIGTLSKAGGVATGTVLAGTFTGLHLARVAAITSATDTSFNGDPLQIAIVGSDPSAATSFTYTLSGTGSAGGSPQIQLYRYFTVSGIQVFVDQGLTAG